MERILYVYILTNRTNGVLYTGVTNDIARRLEQHRLGMGSGFTKKYKTTKLVYLEQYHDPWTAILREKQIKGGSRRKKIQLIESLNPEWKYLSSQP